VRSVPFQQALHGTARLLGLNPTRDLNSDRAATLTDYLNRVFKPAWNFDWWPEWMECEQRTFRQAYVPGEFIQAGMERYHEGSDDYYQALQEQPAANQAPATTIDGVNWTENSAYWAKLKTDYSAALQTDGESLVAGDLRMDVDTRRVYQIFTPHTAAGRNIDITKAHRLELFRRYVAFEQEGQTPIGTVKAVYIRDPRTWPRRPGRIPHQLNGSGIVVLPGQQTPMVATAVIPTRMWIEFRRRPPVFTSTPWTQRTEGNGYNLGDLVYYQGEVFKSLVGDNWQNLDNTEQWERIGFPEILAEACELAAAALALGDQKQPDRAADLRAQASERLTEARDIEIVSQQENETAEVKTYGS